MFHSRQNHEGFLAIPLKANKVLRVVLLVLFLILLRCFHLAIVQHEKKVEEGFRPRKKVVIEPSSRGTIRDRFNTIIARNRIEYRLAVVYSRFRDIPAAHFHTDREGKKTKRFLRKEYIHALSKILSQHIDMQAERIEDLIHSHASMNYNIPFVLQKDLTEEKYYALKGIEKDWVGLELQRVPKRHYPRGRVGADIIGYTGPISQSQYQKVMSEMAILRDYIAASEIVEVEPPEGVNSLEDAKNRLSTLQEKAYAINDDIGRAGTESFFEEELRGWTGRKLFFADAQGNALRKLPGSRRALPGKRVMLALSVELQEFAEKILAQNELDRERAYLAESTKKAHEPWVRGGAIVALDPNTGEVLTLASFPRFDPNDFVHSGSNLHRWLETEEYLANVWDQKTPLKREVWKDGRFVEEELFLTWDLFLRCILPPSSKIPEVLHGKLLVCDIIELQRDFFSIVAALKTTPQIAMEAIFSSASLVEDERAHRVREFCSAFATTKERLLAIDLSRLVVCYEQAQEDMGSITLSEFRNFSSAFAAIEAIVRQEARKIFRAHDFASWKEKEAKTFLQALRKNEKREAKYAKPYLDYFDTKEKEDFELFWKKNRDTLLVALINGTLSMLAQHENLAPYAEWFSESFSFAQRIHLLDETVRQKISPLQNRVKHYLPDQAKAFLHSLQSFKDLTHPLLYSYKGIYRLHSSITGQDLAASFMRGHSPGFRSWAFRQATTQGSIFKLITAYTALKKRFYENGKIGSHDTRFFEIEDSFSKQGQKAIVGAFLSGEPIPQLYKGGRIPKSVRNHIGRVDLLRALETSSNPYFSLLASEYIKNPDELLEAARAFGYGKKSGITLPGEIAGRLPDDLQCNKTGLYSFAIGQHTLVATPLQTALAISAIANGGKILQPKLVTLMAGKNLPDNSLQAVYRAPSLIRKELFMPPSIRMLLLEGMQRVTKNILQEPAGMLGRFYRLHPHMYRDFIHLQDQFIGKSSTAESEELHGIDIGQGKTIYNHTWFGGIAFDKSKEFCLYDSFGKPELVVVVYLRYGGYGKEAAPLAAQIVKKWREIKDEFRQKKQKVVSY